jgi:hypothetical protein
MGYWIPRSLLWQCTRAVPKRLRRRWVLFADPNVFMRDMTRYHSALLGKLP